MTVDAELDARYGRGARRRKRERALLWGGAALFAVILVAWVVWAGLDGSKPTIEAQDTGYTIADEHNVTVTFRLSAPAGTPVSCAVQALNPSFTIVGWKVVDIPAADQYTRAFTESLHTTEEATTGLIYRCWLT